MQHVSREVDGTPLDNGLWISGFDASGLASLRTELAQLQQRQAADAKAQRRRTGYLWACMALLAIAGGIGIAYPYLTLSHLV